MSKLQSVKWLERSQFCFLGKARAGDIVTDAAKRNKQVGGISFSTDLSTGSKSSSVLKSSSTYGSSSATSGMVGEGNFSIQEIYKMTDNFSPANEIGDGGFSTVYKGRLRDGSYVAVKRAKKNTYDKRLLLEFQNEALALSKIEHLNLVRLHGYVEQGDERIIVVEYVGNGNLREHLDGKKGSILEIAERLDIAIDVAHAITYLHTYTDPPIIHRDIKASNVLITEKLRAKVADFGLARLTTEGSDATHISTQVKGTTGYLDPEYLRTYQLTEKSDVYSFGVLLVELMSGRHPIEQKRSLKEKITIKWAMQRLKEGDAIFVMDPLLRRSPGSTMTLEKVLKLARQCLAPSKQSRPSMKECCEVLWGIRKDLKASGSSSLLSLLTNLQTFLGEMKKRVEKQHLVLEMAGAIDSSLHEARILSVSLHVCLFKYDVIKITSGKRLADLSLHGSPPLKNPVTVTMTPPLLPVDLSCGE
ncbi:CALMODULIN-BINDING RECEPTOR-LIKE CYTOPLASMIC KINASE 1 [Salix purpurea]|uniref:non-specific serine/threonine protein kinase n=1 Tax=Salix purpurea TaxID=77065 RepID=A0A9Q0SWC7_SALPP|nr:CALMODULIN-BINDING RECEPTOR-LIKE CYTOPLASMIC KINASE 1 [Salix purpurea]